MEIAVGLAILFLFGVCIYGIVDVIRQINKLKKKNYGKLQSGLLQSRNI